MKKAILLVIANHLRSIRAWNLAFCSFAICVVITAHAGLIPGHTPPLLNPGQQEASTGATELLAKVPKTKRH